MEWKPEISTGIAIHLGTTLSTLLYGEDHISIWKKEYDLQRAYKIHYIAYKR